MNAAGALFLFMSLYAFSKRAFHDVLHATTDAMIDAQLILFAPIIRPCDVAQLKYAASVTCINHTCIVL